MNVIQAFKMSLQSISANKVRTFLTMLGIIIGVGAVIIMVSVVQGFGLAQKAELEARGTNRINIYASQWNGQDITQDLYDYCLSLNDLVLGVSPSGSHWSQGGVRYMTQNADNNEQYGSPQIYYGSDQFSLCNNNKVVKGRDLSYLDVQHYEKVVVLGAGLADYLFQAQNPVGKSITISGQDFLVIGVYAANDPGTNEWSGWMDYFGVIPYTLSRQLDGRTSMEEFVVKASSSQTTTEAITRISGFLSGIIDPNTGNYNVYTENTWQESANEGTNMIGLVLGGIAGISLLVGGIGIMNIMLVTVSERTREIGIRKAIGGSRRSIITQFLIESSLICGLGGIGGIILGYLGTVVAGKLILKTLILPEISLTLGAVAFSVVLGMAFGMYPAIKASGLQPVEALRGE